MVERRVCTFCGDEIEPGTGRMYIKKDGIVYHFCTSKCFKNMILLGRVPRRTTWTRYYEREKQVRLKGLAPAPPEAPKARKLKKREAAEEAPSEKEPGKAEEPREASKEEKSEAGKKPAAKEPEKKGAAKKSEARKKEKPAPRPAQQAKPEPKEAAKE